MIDFREMTFLTVCDTMNFTRAAEKLHITQPAVSQHIHYLEETYGAKLFYYTGKKIHLTRAGELLRQAAEAARNDENLLRERIADAGSGALPLHFGVTMTVGDFVIGKPLAAYLRTRPDVTARMEMGNTSELLELLHEGELNFAVVEGYFDRAEFDSEEYRSEKFIPVCSAKRRFKAKPRRLKELLSETVLVREPGSGTREVLDKQLKARNLSFGDFSKIIQIGSMPAILDMLEEDAGISFMYYAAARQGIENGALREIRLEDFIAEHEFAFIWERGSVYAEEYREICRLFREASYTNSQA